MANSIIEFTVRRWSDTNKHPFDVIALDHENNKQHYQPGAVFSSERMANEHADRLTCIMNANPDQIKFIRDFWPIDGSIK